MLLPLPTGSRVTSLKPVEPDSAPLGHTEARLQDHLRFTEVALNSGLLSNTFLV